MIEDANPKTLASIPPERWQEQFTKASFSTDLLVTLASEADPATHHTMIEGVARMLAPVAHVLTDRQLTVIVANINQPGHYFDSDAAEKIREACDASREELRDAGRYAGTAHGWQPL